MGGCCASNDLNMVKLNLTHDNLQGVKFENLKFMIDPTKKFKYMFPFYRMNIETLEYKLNRVKCIQQVNTTDTDLFHIDEFKKVFKTTPAWNE